MDTFSSLFSQVPVAAPSRSAVAYTVQGAAYRNGLFWSIHEASRKDSAMGLVSSSSFWRRLVRGSVLTLSFPFPPSQVETSTDLWITASPQLPMPSAQIRWATVPLARLRRTASTRWRPNAAPPRSRGPTDWTRATVREESRERMRGDCTRIGLNDGPAFSMIVACLHQNRSAPSLRDVLV